MSNSWSEDQIRSILKLLKDKCPRLFESCYWAGTSAISSEESHHRISYDFDFHTISALLDVRPLLSELQRAFPGKVNVIQKPDQLGSSFRATVDTSLGEFTLEVLSNFEDVAENELTPSKLLPTLKRVTVQKYLLDKIQCIVERNEARDLVDIQAIISRRPDLEKLAKEELRKQDLAILVERLTLWTEDSLKSDLSAYPDVNLDDAIKTKEKLLAWSKELTNE